MVKLQRCHLANTITSTQWVNSDILHWITSKNNKMQVKMPEKDQLLFLIKKLKYWKWKQKKFVIS